MKPDLEGLTKLAQQLKQVPRREFNMREWWQSTPCGTSGCIAGWAAHLFPSRFKKVIEGEYDGRKYYAITNRRTGSIDAAAFADGFHIGRDEAEALTTECFHHKRTPKAAAKAVMALVGKLKKQLK